MSARLLTKFALWLVAGVALGGAPARAAIILSQSDFDDTSGLAVIDATATPQGNGTTLFTGTTNGMVNPPPVVLLPVGSGEAVFVTVSALGSDSFVSLSLAFFDSSNAFLGSVDNALNIFSSGFHGIELDNVIGIPSGSTSFVPVLTMGNALSPGTAWSSTLDQLLVAAVPEPSTSLLLGGSLAGVALIRRRR